MEIKLELTKREVIKPSLDAPHDRLQLSLFDLSCPEIYVATTFFYKSVIGESQEIHYKRFVMLLIISQRLKTSLSETLSRFYPLAGRIEGISVSCNDEGVVFSEARTDLLLSDFLRNLNTDSLGAFFPEIEKGESAGTWPLLRVKVSFFGSGSGVAVTVGISHKICDATSLLYFVQGWAATAKAKFNDEIMSTPPFAGVTLYPPPQISFRSVGELFKLRGKCVTNRLVFESSKITELKRKAASESIPNPTRVEAITALIWRCATNSSRSNSVVAKSTLMTQAMDLRLRIPSSVLSRDAMGNIQTAFFLKEGVESKMEIGEIVVKFRKAKEGINDIIKEILQGYNTNTTALGQNLLSLMRNFMSELKSDIDLYVMSSWCRKPFYEVDFGWGCPVWIGSPSYTIYSKLVFVVLVDSKDGEGVEAWVSLPEQDMHVFVRDQDLLAYVILNPQVLI